MLDVWQGHKYASDLKLWQNQIQLEKQNWNVPGTSMTKKE